MKKTQKPIERPNKCPFCMSMQVKQLSARKWQCDDYSRQCNMVFDFVPDIDPKQPTGYK